MTDNSSVGSDGRYQVSPGTRLNGIYEIDKLIAIGGMGEIYLGHTVQTGDTVAIKMILPEFAGNETVLALFRKEASVLHNLNHEAIVRYFVFSVDETLKRPYLAMEYVDGPALSDVLKNGALDLDLVCVLQKRLAEGLQKAHELGIIHRDISPDNIILPDGDVSRAKIIDFGIARSNQSKDGTLIGDSFAGKNNYVSPEQLGLFGGDVTARSDIYSLGLVLAAALRGYPIDMGGQQVDVIEKRRSTPNLDGIHPSMVSLLTSMLQPDPADRTDAMATVAAWPIGYSAPNISQKLQRGRDNGPQPLRARSSAMGPRILGSLLAVVLIGVVGAGGWYYWQSTTVNPKPQKPVPDLTDRQPDPRISEPDESTETTQPDPPGPFTSTDEATDKAAANTPKLPILNSQEDTAEEIAPDTQISTLLETEPDDDVSASATPKQFISAYDGGRCFYIVPVEVTENSAKVTGFGSSTGSFEAFDKAFTEANGFEVQIGLRLVTIPQCPVVDLLSNARNLAGIGKTFQSWLKIEKDRLKSGQVLRGSLQVPADFHAALLLIDDAGLVHNLESFTKRSNDRLEINIKLVNQGADRARAQLLLAIVTDKPMSMLTHGSGKSANELFPAVLKEIRETGQSVTFAVKYFKVSG